MLKRVSAVPKAARAGRRESFVAKDVREFCRNATYDVAELVYENAKPQYVAPACRRYIKQHPDQCKGVHVRQRGKRVFLEREVTR